MAARIKPRYGRLLLLERQPGRPSRWLCKCDCGYSVVALQSNLVQGYTESCGCLSAEITAKRNTTHGHTRRGAHAEEYSVWCNMRRRCADPDNLGYGGRGIKVCARWHDFGNFLTDMGPRPPGLTLERKDLNGDYAPDNCIWASQKVQQNNRRNNVRWTHDGRTLTQAQWAAEAGITPQTMWKRLKRGWTLSQILNNESPHQKESTSR